MTDDDSLLAYIALRHIGGREDVATDALAFILNRSDAARSAFADFLRDGDADPPAIAEARTQYSLPNGTYPDLAGMDADGNILALVESKFWAPLTRGQPVDYWPALPTNSAAKLLFIAPSFRVNHGSLWNDMTRRLQQAGHPLGTAHKAKNRISAPAQDGDNPRRLMLCSWDLLLNHLAQAALAGRDWQASFEIAELRGLADSVIAGTDPQRDENIKNLIRSAVNRLVQSGWANTDHFSWGSPLPDSYGRYLHFAGDFAWFGISYDERRRRNQPLWLVFSDNFGLQSRLEVTTDQVRQRLADTASVAYEMLHGYFCVPIDLLPADSSEAMRDALVGQLEGIARKINPDGPTYRKDASND